MQKLYILIYDYKLGIVRLLIRSYPAATKEYLAATLDYII